GLVGGHCIGVDPYYLVHKANGLKYHPQIINAGRSINDSMGGYIGKKVVKALISMGKQVLNSRVLVMGITFKEDVKDIRNSKVVDIIKEMQDFGIKVDVVDPRADVEEVWTEYGIHMLEKPGKKYDGIVLAVSHREYLTLTENDFLAMSGDNGILVDIKGCHRNQIYKMKYWSL
ncbi:MAG: UDP binding domain-containing protein, partial [Bacteroidales bacterium]